MHVQERREWPLALGLINAGHQRPYWIASVLDVPDLDLILLRRIVGYCHRATSRLFRVLARITLGVFSHAFAQYIRAPHMSRLLTTQGYGKGCRCLMICTILCFTMMLQHSGSGSCPRFIRAWLFDGGGGKVARYETATHESNHASCPDSLENHTH